MSGRTTPTRSRNNSTRKISRGNTDTSILRIPSNNNNNNNNTTTNTNNANNNRIVNNINDNNINNINNDNDNNILSRTQLISNNSSNLSRSGSIIKNNDNILAPPNLKEYIQKEVTDFFNDLSKRLGAYTNNMNNEINYLATQLATDIINEMRIREERFDRIRNQAENSAIRDLSSQLRPEFILLYIDTEKTSTGMVHQQVYDDIFKSPLPNNMNEFLYFEVAGNDQQLKFEYGSRGVTYLRGPIGQIGRLQDAILQIYQSAIKTASELKENNLQRNNTNNNNNNNTTRSNSNMSNASRNSRRSTNSSTRTINDSVKMNISPGEQYGVVEWNTLSRQLNLFRPVGDNIMEQVRNYTLPDLYLTQLFEYNYQNPQSWPNDANNSQNNSSNASNLSIYQQLNTQNTNSTVSRSFSNTPNLNSRTSSNVNRTPPSNLSPQVSDMARMLENTQISSSPIRNQLSELNNQQSNMTNESLGVQIPAKSLDDVVSDIKRNISGTMMEQLNNAV